MDKGENTEKYGKSHLCQNGLPDDVMFTLRDSSLFRRPMCFSFLFSLLSLFGSTQLSVERLRKLLPLLPHL